MSCIEAIAVGDARLKVAVSVTLVPFVADALAPYSVVSLSSLALPGVPLMLGFPAVAVAVPVTLVMQPFPVVQRQVVGV